MGDGATGDGSGDDDGGGSTHTLKINPAWGGVKPTQPQPLPCETPTDQYLNVTDAQTVRDPHVFLLWMLRNCGVPRPPVSSYCAGSHSSALSLHVSRTTPSHSSMAGRDDTLREGREDTLLAGGGETLQKDGDTL